MASTATASDPSAAALADPSARPVGVPWLARFALSIFFREVEVVGAARLPRDRPLMIVANHVNSLIDPALLIGFLPVRPRFLAKSTLWQMAFLRPFLRWAAAIPVYRRSDPGVDTAKNADTFAACHEALRAKGVIALFPEGTSHNEPALIPLKTGVSRIVLEAEAKFADGEKDGLGSRIVPVGLTFDEKGRFRSRALIHVGEPLDPAPEIVLYATEPREAVSRLTARVAEALAEVTLNFPSWEEARLIERAAEIYQRKAPELPAETGLEERFEVRRAFIAGYRELRGRHPEEIERVAAAVRRYDELLSDHRLRDAQVAAAYPPRRVARFVVKSLALMAWRAPLAILGTVLHYPAWRGVRAMAQKKATSPDLLSTYKLFPSLVAYPATWLLVIVAAGFIAGAWAALGAAVVAPWSAVMALRYHERREHFARQARAYLLLRSGRPGIEELRRLRREVLTAVEALAEVWQRSRDEPGSRGSL